MSLGCHAFAAEPANTGPKRLLPRKHEPINGSACFRGGSEKVNSLEVPPRKHGTRESIRELCAEQYLKGLGQNTNPRPEPPARALTLRRSFYVRPRSYPHSSSAAHPGPGRH